MALFRGYENSIKSLPRWLERGVWDNASLCFRATAIHVWLFQHHCGKQKRTCACPGRRASQL